MLTAGFFSFLKNELRNQADQFFAMSQCFLPLAWLSSTLASIVERPLNIVYILHSYHSFLWQAKVYFSH